MLLILDTTVTFTNCTHGELRLAGSNIVTKGRVEICFNGVWGTVCDNDWSTVDANVVCNQLGYYPSGTVVYDNITFVTFTLCIIGAKARYGAFFGKGSGPIFLSNLQCSGSEQRLLVCNRNTYSVRWCRHYEDAGVECEGMTGQAKH